MQPKGFYAKFAQIQKKPRISVKFFIKPKVLPPQTTMEEVMEFANHILEPWPTTTMDHMDILKELETIPTSSLIKDLEWNSIDWDPLFSE
jgi:hypothetical protein